MATSPACAPVLTRPCASCGSGVTRVLFTGYGFDDSAEAFPLLECSVCGLVATEPPLEPAQLAAYYSLGYYGSSEAKFRGALEAVVDWLQRRRAQQLARLTHVAGQGRVLDVGCGRGLFLRAMRSIGFEAVGTELPGFDFPAGEVGVRYLHADAASLPFEDASFDIVSCWHVLEHTTDPAGAMASLARVLRPGGILALAVPNFGSWQARFFGRHWFHLDLPRHRYHFRRPALARLLQSEGIDAIAWRTGSWEQNLYGFMQSCLNALFWRRAPNGLYRVLKKHQQSGKESKLRLAAYLVLAATLLPAGVVENLVSTTCHRGATLIVYGRKRNA